jgi:transcription antitermination factor NusG
LSTLKGHEAQGLMTGAAPDHVRTSLIDIERHDARPTMDVVGADAAWRVLHTRSRQEKSIARALKAAGIAHYLPLVQRVGYRGRRKRVVETPLFTSYVFLYGPMDAVYFAVSTKRVANVIPVPDQDGFVMEMEQIRRALECGADLGPADYLAVGCKVRVTAGPFVGLEGLIEDRARADRLILQVAALGRGTSLEIDADLLEAVD